MMFLMRLYPRENASLVWDFVQNELRELKEGKVKPLLASKQTDARFITLYLMSDDIEAIGDFIANVLGKCRHIESTMTIPLLKMVFFPVPKDMPQLPRYSIMIHCNLPNYFSAFRSVIDLEPDEGIYPIFSAFLLGKWDIMLSACAASRDDLEKFIDAKLKKIEGIRGVDIFPIERSEIICPEEDWKRLQRTLLCLPSWITEDLSEQREFAFYLSDEDISISGMMEH